MKASKLSKELLELIATIGDFDVKVPIHCSDAAGIENIKQIEVVSDDTGKIIHIELS